MQWPAVNMVGRGGSSGGERSLAGRRAQQLDDQIEHWVRVVLARVNLVLIPHCKFHYIPNGRGLRDSFVYTCKYSVQGSKPISVAACGTPWRTCCLRGTQRSISPLLGNCAGSWLVWWWCSLSAKIITLQCFDLQARHGVSVAI